MQGEPLLQTQRTSGEEKLWSLESSSSRNQQFLPFLGVIVVTGVPEPLDCRLRNAVHGAAEGLFAA